MVQVFGVCVLLGCLCIVRFVYRNVHSIRVFVCFVRTNYYEGTFMYTEKIGLGESVHHIAENIGEWMVNHQSFRLQIYGIFIFICAIWLSCASFHLSVRGCYCCRRY